MFSGIIQSVGRVVSVRPTSAGRKIRIQGRPPGPPLRAGESVSVDGVCLSVQACTPGGFEVTAVPETLRLTSLGRLRAGARVNLERALRFGDWVGGHLVQGHVDGMGRVRAWKTEGGERRLVVAAPRPVLRDLAYKGSVAVHGVSLTVAGLSGDGFEVALVPHTLAATTLGGLRVGNPVNLEVDLFARYVRSVLGRRGGASIRRRPRATRRVARRARRARELRRAPRWR